MTSSSPAVCVVGGGISGLVTAYSIASQRPGVEVTVVEASSRFGGALRTETIDGVRVEAGADSFLDRGPDVAELCAGVGLHDLVAPAIFGASIWSGERLHPLPASFVFGMPASARAALSAPHLRPWARVRAAAEPLLPGRPIARDVGVGDLVRRRFGRSLLKGSVDPLLAGTRAGRPDDMSLEAALPQVWGLVRGRRSVMRALAAGAARGEVAGGPPPFKTVPGGLERLVDALVEHSNGVDLRRNTRAETIDTSAERVHVGTTTGVVECDAVVLASPAFESARVLRAVNQDAAALLERIEFASVATITLVYGVDAVAQMPGSGVLVPSHAGTTISACTWYSVKWPGSAPPDGGAVVRCFVGRAGASPALAMDDDELVRRVARDVNTILGVRESPRTTHVTRWERALPQYRVGHVDLVARIRSALESSPQIHVTGASYEGSGIPDCVRIARRTARDVLGSMRP